MKFTKMHGIGNDYVYVNCLEETVDSPEETARLVSDRHFGIGSDGLILIKGASSKEADFEMEMYNADGSRGNMCGNGIRCVAKYVYDHGLTKKTKVLIDTRSGVKELTLTVENDKVSLVRVNMGKPEFAAKKIPVISDSNSDEVIRQRIQVAGSEYEMTCVSMGNPHCVVFLDDLNALNMEKTGPAFENQSCFPDRINTEFVEVLDRHTLKMRVWERGSGETLACGTGACATAAAAIRNGLVDDTVTVRLLGGELLIEWEKESGDIYMTGPATEVFEGEIQLP